MPRKKLQKIEALHHLSNVIELNDPQLKNKLANFLGRNKNITLELGCGKGEYTLALAKLFPLAKFIGIDLQGERLWHGASQAQQENLDNVLFLRLAVESIDQIFDKHSIKEIWLTFPDPQAKNSDSKKRLTSPRFLKIYQHILKPQGLIHLKTDSQNLFDYSQTSVKQAKGQILIAKTLAHDTEAQVVLNIMTGYEKKYRLHNKPIYYLQAKLYN